MLFISKKKLESFIKDRIEKSSRSLIDDSLDYKKTYRDRELYIGYSDMWNMYIRNEWIRACVDKTTKGVAATSLYAVPREGKEQNPETQRRVEEIQVLLDDPNTGLESFSDIRRSYLRDVLIYDAGAIEIVYDKEEKPAEIYSIPGERVRMVVDEHGNFVDESKAYVLLQKDSYKENLVTFARRELVYLVANPKSGSVYGLSPLESLYYAVLNDISAAKYNSDFFANNAEASGLLGVEGMTFADLQRFRAYWNNEIKGKSHRTAIVNNKVTWTPMNMTNRDMQFLEYQRWLLCKIMAVYSMQSIVLGVIDPTMGKLNSEQQLEAWKDETIKPLLDLESYQITKVLIQQGFGYDDVVISHDPIDIKDETANTSIAVQLVNTGIITVNEARKLYFGLEEVEGADKLSSATSPSIVPEASPTSTPIATEPGNLPIEEIPQIPQEEKKNIVVMGPSINYVFDKIEKRVIKQGNKWCVVHAHPKVTGSTTDRAPGTVIKCFPTKQQAEAMHRAIQISQAKETGKF
jgi:HK97 family phage portal protein